MAVNYDINYNDKRFTQVENDKKEALSDIEQTYGGMVSEADKYYQAQIDAQKQWADKQTQLQQEQTDFAIDKIEQEKAQAKQDYTKEQSGAYTDWQKQSNAYGVNAEKKAAAGLAGTGYSESSMVSMYNTYQNRVTAAREAYTRAVLNYDNSIKEAKLQNNSLLAEIAFESLQNQLKLSLEGFQYKNTLLLEKAEQKRVVDQDYHNRYLAVLDQINTENALKEQVRQADMANAREQERIKIAQAELKLSQDRFAYEKQQDAQAKAAATKAQKAAASRRGKSVGSAVGSVAKSVKSSKTKTNKSTTTAADYFDEMVRNGATKADIATEITVARMKGEITAEEARALQKKFAPPGIQYN